MNVAERLKKTPYSKEGNDTLYKECMVCYASFYKELIIFEYIFIDGSRLTRRCYIEDFPCAQK